MVIIREALEGDIPLIIEYQLKMALETENLWLDESNVQKGVKAVFQFPSKGKYYMAEKTKEVVGTLLITYEWSDWRNATVLWLQSVYVKQEHRGKGVFKTMFQFIKNLVKSSPTYCGVRLYVVNSNEQAKSAYKKLGMNDQHYEMFEWMKN
ncbi:MAG: GNAT family N-acetyltransferase [Cyclobacteriaceae bacterium]|nr:GNAT family N-acetyltransferase [Cyclobacteriaceae bacterium]